MIMIMSGTIKALFHQLGIKIDDRQIAKALPCRPTFQNMEIDVAVDCLLRVCQEMKEDLVREFGLTADHGHRKDQDHFVKLISWAGKDEDDNWTIKFHCVDIVSMTTF